MDVFMLVFLRHTHVYYTHHLLPMHFRWISKAPGSTNSIFKLVKGQCEFLPTPLLKKSKHHIKGQSSIALDFFSFDNANNA